MNKRIAVTALLPWILPSVLIWGLPCSTALAQHDRSLPGNEIPASALKDRVAIVGLPDQGRFQTVAAVRIVDFPRVRKQFEEYPLGGLVTSSGLESFRLELAEAGMGNWLAWNAGSSQPWNAITELAQHDLFAFVTDNSDQNFDITLILDTASDISTVEQRIGQLVAALVAEGAEIETEITNQGWKCVSLRSQRNHVSFGWTTSPAIRDPRNANTAIGKDNLRGDEPSLTSPQTMVCVSSNSRLVEESLNEHDGCLETVVQRVFRWHLPEAGKPGRISWFWNPPESLHRGSRHQNAVPTEKETMEQVSSATELPWNWESIACLEGNLEFLPSSECIVGDLVIKMKAGRKEGMFQILGDPDDAAMSCLGAVRDLTFWARINWNRHQLFQYLSASYDQLTETPEAFKQTLGAAKEELGVDLERELFSNLRPVAQVAGLSQDKLSRPALVFVFDIDRPQPNADRIAEILHRLFAEDPESQAQGLEGYSHPLWRIKLDFDANQMETWVAGAMVVGNQFWCSTQADALVQFLEITTQKETSGSKTTTEATVSSISLPVQDHQLQQIHAELLSFPAGSAAAESARHQTVMLGYLDIGRSLEPAYVSLKNGGVDAVEASSSIASQCMQGLLKLDDRIQSLDFGKLPDYSQVGPGLGEILLVLEPHVDGWLVKFEHFTSGQNDDSKGDATE